MLRVLPRFIKFNATPKYIPINTRIHARFISNETKEKIEKAIQSHPVCLFMKGTPDFPQCGFSRAAVAILNMQGVEKFASVNILEDEEVRAGIKEYSSWPTIPQLYVKGEFIGGCDIMMQMHQDGEMEKLLLEKGVVVPEDELEGEIRKQ